MAVEMALVPTGVSGAGDVPTALPDGHVAFPDIGPHTVKVTVPPGAPPALLPVTVAVSVTDPPRLMEPEPDAEADCCVLIDEVAAPTVKHSLESTSPLMLSLEPVYLDALEVKTAPKQ